MENKYVAYYGNKENEHISHYGILGMKWGVRRYQNKDGSLTPLGKQQQDEKNKFESAESDVKKRLTNNYKPLKKKEIDPDDISKIDTSDILDVIDRSGVKMLNSWGGRYECHRVCNEKTIYSTES